MIDLKIIINIIMSVLLRNNIKTEQYYKKKL